jgi:hypothetical protein
MTGIPTDVDVTHDVTEHDRLKQQMTTTDALEISAKTRSRQIVGEA